MVRKAKRFGIDQEEMAKLDISKGLEIFRLDDGEQVKQLMNRTIRRGIPLKDLKREVAVALGLVSEAEPQTVRKVWHFSESQWSVINQAIQTIQLTSHHTRQRPLPRQQRLLGHHFLPSDRRHPWRADDRHRRSVVASALK